jgi:small-conductance mechanosensitive channel
MPNRILKTIGLLTVVLTAPPLFTTGAFAQDAKSSDKPAVEEKKEQPPPGLAELVSRSSKLHERLNRLQEDVGTVFDLAAAREWYDGITLKLDTLSERIQAQKAIEKPTYQDLAELKAAIRARDKANNDRIGNTTEAIRKVERWRIEWLKEYQQWTRWQETLLTTVSITSVEDTFTRAQKTISEALDLIRKNLGPLLVAQQKLEELHYRIYQFNVEVDRLILAVRGDVLQKQTPVMFSARFFSNLRRAMFLELPKQFRISWPDRDFFVEEAWVIFLQVIVALGIALGVRRRRPQLQEMPQWRFVAKRPYAAGFTFAIPILSVFYGPLPAVWQLVLWAVAGISLSRLASGITADVWKRRSIYGLAAVVIVNQLLPVLGLPQTFGRLYVFGISLIGFLFFLWRAVRTARDGSSGLFAWIMRLAALFLLVVFVAEVIGQTVFAMQVFNAVNRSVIFILFGWMLITLIRGGLELVVKSPVFEKIPLLRRNATVILRRSMLVVQILIWTFIFSNILVDWGLFNLPSEAIQGFLALGFTVGEKKITIGLVFTAVAILYGSFIVSWAVQTVLMEEVLRRRQVELGVRMSMGRLVHYVLILVGFLIALSALGFDLQNITILGGALGIGIGFGLQTVVSNFVCGLILLFERPLKVGDVIDLGTQRGRVKKLGLRATVVQTFDQAEVVVPNTDLISNQVTNWTLADRKMRLTIPVGVAYGSDIGLVMKTLNEIAEENASVLKDPPPQVLFATLGASSLDFDFRVWLSDYGDRRRVQSELLVEIDRRFRELDIEIPFPQTDLHVRSVNSQAAESLPASDKEKLSADPLLEESVDSKN